MKLKLDENLPADAVAVFRDAEHDVETVIDEDLGGAVDTDVLAACKREGRVLITFDTDFADVRRYPPGTHGGIVVLRLHDQRWATLRRHLTLLVESGVLDEVVGGLAIVAETRVRLRRRP